MKQFIAWVLLAILMVHICFLYLYEREQRILLECQLYAPAEPSPTDLFDTPRGL